MSLVLCACVILPALYAYPQSKTFPEPPILIYPPDMAILRYPGTGVLIPFAWDPVEESTGYQINVVVGTRPAASEITTETSIELDLGLSVRDIQETIRWSVRAVSEGEFGNASPNLMFTLGIEGTPIPGITPVPTPMPTPTPTLLPPPQLLSPEDGAVFDEIHALQGIDFEWTDRFEAALYLFTIYKDNELFRQRTLEESTTTESIAEPVRDVYQWNVQAIDRTGRIGAAGLRFSFTVGTEFYPTPTPVPPSSDLNGDGVADASDLFLYAVSYRTNDSKTDLNNSGLNDRQDLLLFMQLYWMMK